MLMAAAALLAHTPKPTDADIDAAMSNICRCGTYQRVRAAIHRAANSLSGGATKSASDSAAPKASGSAA
jgi:isoquinoline 1-oxidoreductase alpha subunit